MTRRNPLGPAAFLLLGGGNRPPREPQPPQICCPTPSAGGEALEGGSAVPTVAALTALDTNGAQTGDRVLVVALDYSGFTFVDFGAGGTPPAVNGITVVATQTGGNTRWIRDAIPTLDAQLATAWFIDGTAGADTNDGHTAATPIASYEEFVRRTGAEFPLQNPITTVDVLAAPDGQYNQRVTDPSLSGRVLRHRIASTVVATGTSTTTAYTPPDPTDATAASIGLIDFNAFAPTPLAAADDYRKILRLTVGGTSYYGAVAYASATQVQFDNLFDENGNPVPSAAGQIPNGTAAALFAVPSVKIGLVEGDPRSFDGSNSSRQKSVEFVGLLLEGGLVKEAALRGCVLDTSGQVENSNLQSCALATTEGAYLDIQGGTIGARPLVQVPIRQGSFLSEHVRVLNAIFNGPEHTAVGEIYVPSGAAILQIGSDSTLRINVANNGLYGDVAPAILGHNASLRRNSATTITKNGTAITWPAGGANVTDGVLPLAATAAVNAWNGAGNYNTENNLIETQSLAQTYIQA